MLPDALVGTPTSRRGYQLSYLGDYQTCVQRISRRQLILKLIEKLDP